MNNVTFERVAKQLREYLDKQAVLMVSGSITFPPPYGADIKARLDKLLDDRRMSVETLGLLWHLLEVLIPCAKDVGYSEWKAAMDSGRHRNSDKN